MLPGSSNTLHHDEAKALIVLARYACSDRAFRREKQNDIYQQQSKKMNIIISLIIYLVVFGLIWWLVGMLPLPAPVAQIVRILFIILLILIILSVVGILPGGYLPKLSL